MMLKKNDHMLSIVNKIYAMFMGVLSSSFCTRLLGVEYRGEYSYISQVANILVLILNFGIYQSYVYNFRRQGRSILPKYLSVFIMQFISYLILFFVIAFISKSYTLCLILALVPFNCLKLQMENIMLVENFKAKMLTNMFNVTLIASLYFVFWKFGAGNKLFIVILITVLVDILTVVIYFIVCKEKISIKYIDFSFFCGLLKFGFFPMLSALLVSLNYNIDIIFLKKMGTQYDLSIYSVAAAVVNYVWMIPDALRDVLSNRVARNDNKTVAISVKASTTFCIMVFITFILFGKIVLRILYGEDFVPSYKIVLILFLGVFSMIYFKLLGVVLISEGRNIGFFCIMLISVVSNVVANYLFVPRYGGEGAAWASVISYSVCGITFLFYFSKLHKKSVKKYLFFDKEEKDMVLSKLFKKGERK